MKNIRKSFSRKREYLVLGVLLIVVSVGYALLSGGFGINGLSILNHSVWDVHFANANATNNSTVSPAVAPSAPPASKLTSISYEVNFTTPGEVYEFTVDVVNGGTINAKIEGINSTIKIGNGQEAEILADKSNIPSYLNYSVTYSDDSEIEEDNIINAGDLKTIKVHVEFKRDISEEELADASEKTIRFSMEVDYEQTKEKDDSFVDSNPLVVDMELVDGAEYVDGQYTYTYIEPGDYDFRRGVVYLDYDAQMHSQSYEGVQVATPTVTTKGGWHVKLTDPDSTAPVVDAMRTSINHKPIISMDGTYEDSKAVSIDLSSVDTSNVISMIATFSYTKTPEIDVSGFDTSKVISMSNMFFGSSITSIEGLTSFNTSNVINMSAMFHGLAVKTLDLSSFDTHNVLSMRELFGINEYYFANQEEMDEYEPLHTIYASDNFVTTGLVDLSDFFSSDYDTIFWNTPYLVGGRGTKYGEDDNWEIGPTYARIDRIGAPGYFTLMS